MAASKVDCAPRDSAPRLWGYPSSSMALVEIVVVIVSMGSLFQV